MCVFVINAKKKKTMIWDLGRDIRLTHHFQNMGVAPKLMIMVSIKFDKEKYIIETNHKVFHT